MLEGSLTGVIAMLHQPAPAQLPILPASPWASGVQDSVDSRLLSPDSSQECSGKPTRKRELVRDEGDVEGGAGG